MSRIVCPKCSAVDTIFVEGRTSIPVIVEGRRQGFDRDEPVWDWDNAEMVSNTEYCCSECGMRFFNDYTAEDFIVRDLTQV